MKTLNLTYEDSDFKIIEKKKKIMQESDPSLTKWEDVVLYAVMEYKAK